MVSLTYIFLMEIIIWWILHIQIRLDIWHLIQGRLFDTTFQNSKVAANAFNYHHSSLCGVVERTFEVLNAT